MSDLGTANNGLTPEELSREVIKRLIENVEKAAKAELKKRAQEEAKKAIKNQINGNVSQETKDKFKKLQDASGQ